MYGEHLITTRNMMWDLSVDLLAVADQDGYFVDLSPSWPRTLGHSIEELTSRPYITFVHPDDVESTLAAAAELRTPGHVTVGFTCRYRCADQSYRWLSWNVHVTPDGQRLYCVARDVTEVHQVQERLEVEEQFRLAIEFSASAMCITSPTGRYLLGNSAHSTLLGRSPDELETCTWQDITHPDDLDKDLQLFSEVLSGSRNSYRLIKRYLSGDGGHVWGDLSVGAVRNSDGSVRYLVSHIVDVTDRVVAEAALAEREALLKVVLDNSSEATMRLDSEMRLEYVNQRAIDAFEIPIDGWRGRSLLDVGFNPELAEATEARLRRVFETGEPGRYEFEFNADDGHRWFEASLVAELSPEGGIGHVVSTSRDITERKHAESELLRMATHDPLTGLANRTALITEITHALAAGLRSGNATGVLMVDLDRFKIVNDSLGHAFVDALLRAASDRLVSAVRGGDLVARPGGDEFIVVMRDLPEPAEAIRAAWRLVQVFRDPFVIHGFEVFATASVGVSVAAGAAEADDIIREADTALYVAKDEGRDRVSVFNEELRAEVIARLTIEGELRHALPRHQLVVWYQPEIDLISGEVIAVEALVRWMHPNGEVYSADRFIEVAEDTGLILDIGDWVLEEICLQAARWSVAYPSSRLMTRVNVSALQLAEAGLLEAFDDALGRSGVDPALLCVEITETALLRETSTTRDNLAGIRERGIRIALDDFGTGYASLAYLRDYHIDALKIDRSFVADITGSEQSQRLVAGIIALAEALGISVTAEGVERQEQADLLRELQCQGAQGFFYSKAVPPDAIAALLQRTADHG